VDLCVELATIAKSGSWFSYNHQNAAQGREDFKKLLQDNPELVDGIAAKIGAVLDNVED
jgi:recombination protein RecA